MTDCYIIADDAGIVVSHMKANQILDVGAFADGNIIDISPGNDAGPQAGVLGDTDISVEGNLGRHESVLVDLRLFSFIRSTLECIHRNPPCN